MVAKAKLRSKDKESGEGSVASVNESRKEVNSLCVDGKRLKLKDDLNRAMKNGEDKIDGCNS